MAVEGGKGVSGIALRIGGIKKLGGCGGGEEKGPERVIWASGE